LERGEEENADNNRDLAVTVVTTMKPWRVFVFGDSNTWRPPHSAGRWTSLVEKYDARFTLLNYARDGRTIASDSGDLKGCAVFRSTLESCLPVDCVIILLGTNDAKPKYKEKESGAVAAGIHSMLDVVKSLAKGTPVILMTPPPLGVVKRGDLFGGEVRLLAIANTIRALANSEELVLIDLNLCLDPVKHLSPDGVHLNLYGRGAVARKVLATLHRIKAS